ncbi:MAG TPA: N-6 DNA methylase [Candidatus Dormibacteraeota bacterium]|jgi:type I restriction enzyme M protein|nr:N-6 DNA methylase [Candidatus Dormibacteraeota bacterium]
MTIHLSEQRARAVTKELLSFRGWDLRPVSSGGQLLEESEYLAYGPLFEIFKNKSKTGSGIGKPDFLLVDSPAGLNPLVVIDTKPRMADIEKSISDTKHYAEALFEGGRDTLAVAVAGAEKESYEVRVERRVSNGTWRALTIHQRPIDWIPSPQQTEKILRTSGMTEVSPERPPDQVLAGQAKLLNEIFRECNIKDEWRPINAAAFMLAVWYGEVSTDPTLVLGQINTNAAAALKKAKKPELSQSLRVDTENEELASRAWQVVDILKKLDIRTLTDHDYLGQLYETFFRYTGGNTIGQYFTPRHIVDFMCDLVGVTSKDTVFDPACGTGGFLIGALKRMIRLEHLDYQEAISRVRDNVYGLESEATTAALCVTNMILRGDGKSGVQKGNCFALLEYPSKPVDFALLNPPFPHKKKKNQKPASAFVDRALLSVKHKGVVAAIVPYSLMANVGEWHHQILKKNRLLFVGTMPKDLFQPYSNYDTVVLVIQKGVPHEDNRVFFSRLDNDGYRLKKAARVPGIGSQIPKLLDNYDSKREVAEFTAYRPVTVSTSEWSPETFIESAPHNDSQFVAGFEEHTRKQASFYIRHGYRLLKSQVSVDLSAAERAFSIGSTISFDDVQQGKFRVEDFFTVKMGGKDEIEDLDDGDDPFVSTSAWDNGVSEWKKANILYPAPAITVATDGSAYTSYVQEFPFYAFYKVALLRPKMKESFPLDALYYVAYLLQREEWRFVRARKYGKARIENTILFGPTKSGKPDFEQMAELSRRCAAFPIIQSFRAARQKSVSERFSELVRQWKSAQRNESSVARMAAHPAYKEIIRMGEAAIPLLLDELRREPDHWFAALQTITGENPVPKGKWGKLKQMTDSWLEWGRERGYER